MQFDVPESFRKLLARAEKEKNFETVAEIVDRILHAASEDSRNHQERGERKAPAM